MIWTLKTFLFNSLNPYSWKEISFDNNSCVGWRIDNLCSICAFYAIPWNIDKRWTYTMHFIDHRIYSLTIKFRAYSQTYWLPFPIPLETWRVRWKVNDMKRDHDPDNDPHTPQSVHPCRGQMSESTQLSFTPEHSTHTLQGITWEMKSSHYN